MLKATAIRMETGYEETNDVKVIDSIYIEGSTKTIGWMKKEEVHDFLTQNPTSEIVVNIAPYPKLIPVEYNGTRYVRSAPNDTPDDNLLELPPK